MAVRAGGQLGVSVTRSMSSNSIQARGHERLHARLCVDISSMASSMRPKKLAEGHAACGACSLFEAQPEDEEEGGGRRREEEVGGAEEANELGAASGTALLIFFGARDTSKRHRQPQRTP